MRRLLIFIVVLLLGPFVAWIWIPILDVLVWTLLNIALAVITGGLSAILTLPAFAIYTAMRAN